MPRSASRSRSPRRDERRRSRSPRRREERDSDRPGKRQGGFRWKEKRRDDDAKHRDDERGLERGYRESYRPRERHDRDDGAAKRRNERDGERDKVEPAGKEKKPKEKKEKKPATAAASSEPMIIVNVNDRLGTKAAIPCLASDPIRLFKAQVAARIGREPHEILLKRQGERPFKDQLSLEDYGVSSGVQLDLEVDTGD